MATQACPKCGFASPEGAKFCSNCGAPLEARPLIEGERRFATVLFADVARSTSIAEGLDPEDWALVMNGAFRFMNAAVARFGGTVSRLMGDAVLALFGAPVAHEDDAERAVRAGLEMQEAGAAYARTVKQRYDIDFDLRVGINTGTAVLAFVGDAIKTEYTAMGDAANVAARLQSAAEPGTVLISAETHRLVRGSFEFRPRGMLEMKGKTAAVEAYEVAGAKVVPESMRGVEGLSSPLVGREREIGILRDGLTALQAGRGSVVAVVGEAGLGKSRLLAELRNTRDALPEAQQPGWLESRAISYGQTIPYYPWRTLGRQIVGASEFDTAAEVREKLNGFVERLQLKQADLPFYELLLAIDDEQSRQALTDTAGEAVVNGVAGAVVNAIKAAARNVRPQVLVLDDLHWSDSASLELVAQVATLAAFEPLLVVCVLRPDRRAASWHLLDRLSAGLGDNFQRLDLEPLPAAAASELLSNLLQIEELPQSVRDQILARSEGNPFYLEEVLRSLIDDGQVVREGQHWRAVQSILQAKIPDTLAGVLSARIDRLPDSTKRVAQTAAVIGRVFQHRVLEIVCRDAPEGERVDHVEPHLATLSFEQLVRERMRDPEREYIFKHALTCEAAYELLLRSRRRDLHARAGRALESLFTERREEYAGMLAHHFIEADDLPKALDYSLRAADSAKRLGAVREELEHREAILKLVDRMLEQPPAVLIDAIYDWATVRLRLGNLEDVLDRLAQAVSLARESNDKQRLGLGLSWTANIQMVSGFPSRSVPYLLEGQKLAEELGNAQMLLLPLFFGTWSLIDHDPENAVVQLKDVIELARQNNVRDIQGHAVANLAVAYARLGRFAEAREQIDEAMRIAPTVTFAVKEADIHIASAMAYYDMGEVEEGLKHAQIGAELALGARGLECACAGYFGVGRGRLQQNRIEEALTGLGRSLVLAKDAGFAGYLNVINGNIAVAEFAQGTPSAVEKLKTSINSARSTNDEFAANALSMELVRMLVQLGRSKEGAALIDPAIAYFRSKSMTPYLIHALEVSADAQAAAGDAERAEADRLEVVALRSSSGPPPPPMAEPAATRA